MGRIVRFAADTGTFDRSKAAFARPKFNLTDEQRLDYGAHVSLCPANLVNVGEARETIVVPSLGANEVLVPVTDEHRAAGDLVGLRWNTPQAKRAMTAEEIAAALVNRQAAMWGQAKARREEIIYSPIGEVDVRGDGTLMVEPDIRNQGDRDNLTGLHTFAVALAAAGVTDAVIAFGDAGNNEVMLTPAEMIALAQAVFVRGSVAYQRGRQLRSAIYAEDADSASLDLIDIQAGSIDGSGSWGSA